ncbi:hypothetical protein [Vibrio hyugaensis]|uniref:hypothetical protein n=1 Tax=Vibrio hyugaensis TaxID=1534743 RepID=UPI0012E03978|nr:hypothetical protein [Vibrio hyugaensis]
MLKKGEYEVEITETIRSRIISKDNFLKNYSKYKHSYSKAKGHNLKVESINKRKIKIEIKNIDYSSKLISFKLLQKIKKEHINFTEKNTYTFGFPRNELSNYSQEMINSVIYALYLKCTLSMIKIKISKTSRSDINIKNLIRKNNLQYSQLNYLIKEKHNTEKLNSNLFYCILMRDFIDTIKFIRLHKLINYEEQTSLVRKILSKANNIIKPSKKIKDLILNITNEIQNVNLEELYQKVISIEDSIISKELELKLINGIEIQTNNQLVISPCKLYKKNIMDYIYSGNFTTGFVGSPIIDKSNNVICHINSHIKKENLEPIVITKSGIYK